MFSYPTDISSLMTLQDTMPAILASNHHRIEQPISWADNCEPEVETGSFVVLLSVEGLILSTVYYLDYNGGVSF